MKKTSEWVPRPGPDEVGFFGAYIVGPPGFQVPAIFHAHDVCAPENMLSQGDPSITMSEVSHITVEVTLMNRLMDPKEHIDYRTGSPLDREKREEWEAMCEAMSGGELGEDPRLWPCIDALRASGRHARPLDPITGAKSNRLSLFSVGDVKIKIPYRDWYPSYQERMDRVVENSSMSLNILAKYMLEEVDVKPFSHF